MRAEDLEYSHIICEEQVSSEDHVYNNSKKDWSKDNSSREKTIDYKSLVTKARKIATLVRWI